MRFALVTALLILLILGSGCAGSRAKEAAPDATEEPQAGVGAVETQEGTAPADVTGAQKEQKGITPADASPPTEETAPEAAEESTTGINATQETQTETPPAPQPINRLTKWIKEGGIRIGGVSSSTIIRNNGYWMYYTGNGIELAKSPDGLNFVHSGQIISVEDVEGVDMATNPAVFETKDGKYRMIFEGSRMSADRHDRKLYSALSSDGLKWTVEAGVRLQDAGDGKPGELVTSVPEVIRLADGRLRMYYTRGATSATALSSDDGLTWTKETNLKLRKVAIDPDIVLLGDGTYRLFFTTFEDEFGIGEQWVVGASSVDGINFEVDEGKLIEPSTPGGLVTDPDVVKTTGGYRMYYGEFRKGEHELYEGEPNTMSAFSSD